MDERSWLIVLKDSVVTIGVNHDIKGLRDGWNWIVLGQILIGGHKYNWPSTYSGGIRCLNSQSSRPFIHG